MDKLSDSAIIPEEVSPKFFAEHLKPYEFISEFIKDKEILEVGCGDGYGAEYLSQYTKQVVAIDYSERNIIYAQNKYKKDNLTFMVMKATSLEFSDNTFDAVCSFQVIEHILEDKLMQYLLEIKRVLKDDGKFYLSTLNLEHVMKSPLTYKKNIAHCSEFTLTELKNLLLRVFPNIEIYGLYLTLKHRFYQRLKKIGIFNLFPDKINPVSRFYRKITTDYFKITSGNLRRAIDFICICRKES